MTTLADMTPKQRAQCVGMWATNHAYTGDGESVGVIACIQHHRVWLIHTDINGEWSVFPTDGITPRPDLPRAWNPDGAPVSAKREYQVAHENGKVAQPLPVPSVERGKGYIQHLEAAGLSAAKGMRIMQRHVTDWEPLEEA